jgi:hypothetical protein
MEFAEPRRAANMRAEPVYQLVAGMSAIQKVGLLQLLKVASSCPKVRAVVSECKARGFDVDRTLAEVLRRFSPH